MTCQNKSGSGTLLGITMSCLRAMTHQANGHLDGPSP